MVLMALMSLTLFFLLFYKPNSKDITLAQSAYPAPDSSDPFPTSQPNSPISAYPPPTTPQPTPGLPDQQDNNALLMDAKAYGSTMGVDLQEAIHRLQLQNEIGELNRKLIEKEADTFAGLWIQHNPDYRVIVMFTQNGDATIRPYVQNGPLVDLVKVSIARATLTDLENARFQAAQIASKSGVSFTSAVNIQKNQAELYVQDATLLINELLKVNAQLPSNVEVVKFSELPRNVSEIGGGVNLSTCTSGFSVMEPSGIKGITTAGHCENAQSYLGVNLPFWSGTPDGGGTAYDIQWHRADQAFAVRNWIWDGSSNRPIYNVRFRASQNVGDWVCKFGRTTGYGCGTVATTSQDGVNVRLDDITVDYGDSGGPWYVNTTAYGTTIARCMLGNGNPCAIYGPVDQIYNILGLTILQGKVFLPLIIN